MTTLWRVKHHPPIIRHSPVTTWLTSEQEAQAKGMPVLQGLGRGGGGGGGHGGGHGGHGGHGYGGRGLILTAYYAPNYYPNYYTQTAFQYPVIAPY